jgi:hypothetical protein
MEYLPYFTRITAGFLAVIALPFLVVLLIRSQKVPLCFSCGAMKMRASRRVSLLDRVSGYLLLRPYRCEGCRERFLAFWLLAESGEAAVNKGERLIRVAFSFWHGIPNRIAIRVVHLHPTQSFATMYANEKPGSMQGSPAVF